MNKGKISTPVMAILFIIGIVLVGGIMFAVMQQPEPAAVTRAEADGEWDQIYQPDATGEDVTVTETDIDTDDKDLTDGSAKIVLDYDINGTAGSDHYLGFGVEVSSNRLENVDITGELDTDDYSSLSTDHIRISEVYLMEDGDEKTVIDPDTVVARADVTDSDEFEFNLDELQGGEYNVVPVIKTIDASGIAASDDLIAMEFDASTDDDIDSFSADIVNSA